MKELWKVGDLARRTGVSVRTLHHYDELGLLQPKLGGRGEARLYGPEELARLQRILSLRQLGFSLNEIRECLDDPAFAPLRVLDMHLERLEDKIRLAQRLRERLGSIASSLHQADGPAAEDLLHTIEVMCDLDQLEQYYTPEELRTLARRREKVGAERMHAVQAEWQELFAAFRHAKERGEDPSSESVQVLARRSEQLIAEFTGGDAGIGASLGRMLGDDPEIPARWGVDPELWAYIGRASGRTI